MNEVFFRNLQIRFRRNLFGNNLISKGDIIINIKKHIENVIPLKKLSYLRMKVTRIKYHKNLRGDTLWIISIYAKSVEAILK